MRNIDAVQKNLGFNPPTIFYHKTLNLLILGGKP